MKRVIIFWDYSNFLVTLNQLAGQPDADRRFDYRRFVETLTSGMDLIKVYLACSQAAWVPVEEEKKKEHKKEKRHFEGMDQLDFFYVKRFERKGEGEKQVDTYLACQMVSLAYENAYDVAIIISGDEDYIPAIEIAQQKGKIVMAISAGKSFSEELQRKADRALRLNKEGDLYFKNFLPAASAE